MNESSIVNALADEFQCHICFDLLDEPRAACAWGHIFCKKCLQELVLQNARHDQLTRCPICRAQFRHDAIEARILGDNEGYWRASRILDWLRQRIVRMPPRDMGLQTDPISTNSIGQQTDHRLPRDVGLQTEPVPTSNAGQQTDTRPPRDMGLQTDPILTNSIGQQTDNRPPRDMGLQTDPILTSSIGQQTNDRQPQEIELQDDPVSTRSAELQAFNSHDELTDELLDQLYGPPLPSGWRVGIAGQIVPPRGLKWHGMICLQRSQLLPEIYQRRYEKQAAWQAELSRGVVEPPEEAEANNENIASDASSSDGEEEVELDPGVGKQVVMFWMIMVDFIYNAFELGFLWMRIVLEFGFLWMRNPSAAEGVYNALIMPPDVKGA